MEVKVTKRLYSAQKSLRRVSANLLGNWRRQLAARRKVIIVLNPAAGGDHPILKTMNSVFQPFDLNWDIDLTHRYGDGWRLAQRAIAKGANVVGIYGGDGTVVEVASGLMGNRVPLGILPGVTCLILQVDNLGIPTLSATLPGPRHGLLDVVVIRKVDFNALVAIAATLTGTDINLLNILAANWMGRDPNFSPLPHWQARQVRVTVDPPQPVQADGEPQDSTPIEVHMLPRPVHVLVPAPQQG